MIQTVSLELARRPKGHSFMRTSPFPLAATLLLTTAILTVFVLDWHTPLGFAVYVFYAPISLLCLWFAGWRAAFLAGGVCSILVIAGWFLSPTGIPFPWSVLNRVMALLVLWSVLWGGHLLMQRTRELEQAQINLRQEVAYRTQAEQALRVANDQLESRVAERTAQYQSALDRWELVTQATHDGVYDWDLTTHLVIVSSHWTEMHGFDDEDEPETFEQWSNRIHPDDRARVLGHLDEYLAKKRQGFREEYRIRRRDNGWIWVLDRALALWNKDGRAVRLVGSEKDITQRKRAEEQLRQHETQLVDLTTKLLRAQDEERQRIARELHDDVTQRLAVLAVEIGSLGRTSPSDASIHAHIEGLRKAAAQLAEDIHHFAYRLHPSLLEHLGLEAAIRDHVDDFGRRTGLKIQYLQRNVPQSLPMDVSTCLYRVTQESLQNVHKHAEASEVLVRLLGTATGVGVCVRDDGKGFIQAPSGSTSRGLGLISMEERVRLFQGTFRIRTSPGKGTEVHAWLPLSDSPLNRSLDSQSPIGESLSTS